MGRAGPDGHNLVVKTPAGDWQVDGKCVDGIGWERTGRPPKITVKPSFGLGKGQQSKWRYHVVLTDGILVPQGDSEL